MVVLLAISVPITVLACENTATANGTCGTNTNTGPDDTPQCTITTCNPDFQCGGKGSTQTDYYCQTTPYQADCATSVGTADYVYVGPYGYSLICDNYSPGGSVPGGPCHSVVEVQGCGW